MGPVAIETLIGHFQNPADIGGLVLVKIEVAGGRVRVNAVSAPQKAEGDERIEKIAAGPWMKSEATLQRGQIFRMFRQLGEHSHFHSA
jgi:hypothetical protein